MAKLKAPDTEARLRPPDTTTLERWSRMRAALPDKIDEVMASFRDDKLAVTPPDAQTEPMAQPLLREVPVSQPVWPWFLAGAGVAAVLLVVGYVVLYPHAAPVTVIKAGQAPLADTSLPPVLPTTPSVPSSLPAPSPASTAFPTAASSPTLIGADARRETVARVQASPSATPKPATAKPSKPVPPRKPAEEEVRYTEDLTPLLRGHAAP
jgi:hypothetical protein